MLKLSWFAAWVPEGGEETMSEVALQTAPIAPHLSPLKAIRKYCVEDCCCDQSAEVRLCPVNDCELYPYRFGKGPAVKPALTSQKSIRAKCLDCSGGSPADVRECWNTECALFHLRMGKNPNLKGKRGSGNTKALERYRERQC